MFVYDQTKLLTSIVDRYIKENGFTLKKREKVEFILQKL